MANRKLLLALVGTLLICAVALFIWYTLLSLQNDPFRGLEGKIYLSLAKQPYTKNPIEAFSFDVGSKALEQLFIDDGFAHLVTKLSPDSSKMAYSSIPLTGEMDARYLIKDIESTLSPLVFPFGDNKHVLRSSDWSPDGGKILAVAKTNKSTSAFSILGWDVYRLNILEKKYDYITDGLFPLFGPDEDILVLKGDGLYLFSSQSTTSVKVWEILDGGAHTGMQLGISEDRSMLAWTVPHKGEVLIIRIDSWNPFLARVEKTLNAHGFWPVFSPDGKYLALEEIDWDGDASNPRLVAFSLHSPDKKILLDLSGYDNSALFVTDWR